MSQWIKVGDEVIVLSGNDKGKTGKVLARGKTSIVVEGVNTCKKSMKKSQENQQGGFVSFEKAIHISNVAFAAEGKKTKLKVRHNKGKDKELVYMSGGKEKVLRKVKK